MIGKGLFLIDWFVPERARSERSELGLARNFVFTHLFGPLLAQSISVFLYLTDPRPNWVVWTMVGCIWGFWALPFVLKATKSLQLVALISVQMLAFAALFGSFHYGGPSSPLLPWLLVALLLGFFYLGDRPWLILGLFTADLAAYFGAYLLNGGFPQRVPLEALTAVGWISISSATVYMCWMANYYVGTVALRSELEVEAERHRSTAVRLKLAKETAERANLSRSIFLAKMSHEFRTPLNAVIGYSELLLDDGRDKGASAQKISDLERINAAGRHLLALVTDVLDVSRIEANTLDYSAERFDLQAFVQDVAATAAPLIAQNRNELVLRGMTGPHTVCTDQTKLRQVVLNLLSNAAKFTSDGTITLTTYIDRRPGAEWIEIEVSDTGVGIGEEDLPRLFKDFEQASSNAGKYGGTGLGLSVSQRLCGLLGGGISVRSKLGGGSTFKVRLPAELANEGALAA